MHAHACARAMLDFTNRVFLIILHLIAFFFVLTCYVKGKQLSGPLQFGMGDRRSTIACMRFCVCACAYACAYVLVCGVCVCLCAYVCLYHMRLCVLVSFTSLLNLLFFFSLSATRHAARKHKPVHSTGTAAATAGMLRT